MRNKLTLLISILIITQFANTVEGQGLIIPVGSYCTVPENGYLRIPSGDTLKLKSSSAGSGSLICNGTISGKAIVERFMTGGKWHLVSPPVMGQSFTGFISNTANNIPWLSGTNPLQYGVMDYDEANDKWNTPFVMAKVGNFESTRGYSIRNRTDGVIRFKGDLNTGNQVVTLARSKYGWNCIGNPFTSPLQVKGIGGILAENMSNIDPKFAGIYVWDEQPNYNNSGLKKDYRVYCNAAYYFTNDIQEINDKYISVGQGFFIKSKQGGSAFNINKSMKAHQNNVTFRSAQTAWPAIRLQASGNNLVSTTVVAFEEHMTSGLDPSYDVAMLKGNPDFAVYSHLVSDDGGDYAVQSLPYLQNSTIIPIGLDCLVATTVSFSLEQSNFVDPIIIILEDREKSVLTELKSTDSKYTAEIKSNTKGIGRFFIHMINSVLGDNSNRVSKMNIFTIGGRIFVEGGIRGAYLVQVFDINGRLVQLITSEGGAPIVSHVYNKGVYLIRISDENGTFTHRVIL